MSGLIKDFIEELVDAWFDKRFQYVLLEHDFCRVLLLSDN